MRSREGGFRGGENGHVPADRDPSSIPCASLPLRLRSSHRMRSAPRCTGRGAAPRRRWRPPPPQPRSRAAAAPSPPGCARGEVRPCACEAPGGVSKPLHRHIIYTHSPPLPPDTHGVTPIRTMTHLPLLNNCCSCCSRSTTSLTSLRTRTKTHLSNHCPARIVLHELFNIYTHTAHGTDAHTSSTLNPALTSCMWMYCTSGGTSSVYRQSWLDRSRIRPICVCSQRGVTFMNHDLLRSEVVGGRSEAGAGAGQGQGRGAMRPRPRGREGEWRAVGRSAQGIQGSWDMWHRPNPPALSLPARSHAHTPSHETE